MWSSTLLSFSSLNLGKFFHPVEGVGFRSLSVLFCVNLASVVALGVVALARFKGWCDLGRGGSGPGVEIWTRGETPGILFGSARARTACARAI